MRRIIKRFFPDVDFSGLRYTPFLWLYAAYLTIRYVDEWKIFPAIRFHGYMRIKIKKHKDGQIKIRERLIFEPWLNGTGVTILNISEKATILVERNFTFGDGIKLFVSANATLVLKGKLNESASGMTADSVVMVKKYLEIGHDCIIAWNTFLTDCDWHGIDGKSATKETIIGDHIWIGVGVKVLKGAVLGKDSIVTSNSIVLQGNYEANSLISGSPAKVIKTGIAQWHRELRPDDNTQVLS